MTDASDYEVYMQYAHWSMGGRGRDPALRARRRARAAALARADLELNAPVWS